MDGLNVATTSFLSIMTGGIGLDPMFIIPFLPKLFIGTPVLAFNEINSSSLVKNSLSILFFLSFQINNPLLATL